MTWNSYHCQLLDPTRPNMMDDFPGSAIRVAAGWIASRMRGSRIVFVRRYSARSI